MMTPLEKARQDPESMKARILASARKLFGEYGYHGTTTRMIAQDVGIDISTLFYHWGEKKDLYEAVIIDLNEALRVKLIEIEKQVHGETLAKRLQVAIDVMSDYLFSNPDVSNLILSRFFNKTRDEIDTKIQVPEYVANVAVAMGLAFDKSHITPEAKARVLAVWNAVFTFVSGETFLRPVLDVDHETYAEVVKETLKFVLIPAFT